MEIKLSRNISLTHNNVEYGRDRIKSCVITKEIDITHCTLPNTVVDVTLVTEIDNDLDFEIDDEVVVSFNGKAEMWMYVSASNRASTYEWNLQLSGCLKYMEGITYYGGVYGSPDDYEGKEYYNGFHQGVYTETKVINAVTDYIPDLKPHTSYRMCYLNFILYEIGEAAGLNYSYYYESKVETLWKEKLHKVGLPVTTAKAAMQYVSFLIGAYVEDCLNHTFDFFTLSETVKEIHNSQIINDAKIEKIRRKNIKIKSAQYEILNGNRGPFLIQNAMGEKQGYENIPFADVWRREPTENDPRLLEIVSGHTLTTQRKNMEDELRVFEAPVSSIDIMQLRDWDEPTIFKAMGRPPEHPNYCPVGDTLDDNAICVKYEIVKTEHEIIYDENDKEFTEIDIPLLSPDWYSTIEERVKTDFGYDSKAIIKIVERPDNLAKFGEAMYGNVKYGVNTGDTTYDIGDKVHCNIRGIDIEGYITRMKFNLNGNIVIKDCEIVFNRKKGVTNNEQILE